jgi:hypothetical protein
MSDLISELEKLHVDISKRLGIDRSNLHFEYINDGEDKVILKLITINPRHKQSFLFHTSNGFGEMDALNKMLEYVKIHKQYKDSYTIQWSLNGEEELHTSYFRGKNIYDVLDKFYYGKDITGTIIFNISLNPIS